MKRPIAISLSPNTEADDVILALKTLFNPLSWFDPREVQGLEKEFASYFGKYYKALAVNSGRSAVFLILKALGIGKDDEVVVQPFSCVAVPNSILWLGAKPVYNDIDESYNLDPKKLSENLSENTKAIIVQHTFGILADIDAIKKVIHNKNIKIIEDCAHALGAKYKNQPVGTLGDISFFSFGRDKIISSVFGGMILCKSERDYNEIKKLRDELSSPSVFWVIQQLFHPILFNFFILPFYNLGFGKFTLGKALLFILQKLGLLSFPVYEEEKVGKRPNVFPKKMPAVLAILGRHQLRKLNGFNMHRKKIAKFYFEKLKDLNLELPPANTDSIWLRFPIRIAKSESLYKYAKENGIVLGKWYEGIIQPAKDLTKMGYLQGSNITAEEYAKTTLNLPTYPTLEMSQTRKVVEIVKLWLDTEQKK